MLKSIDTYIYAHLYIEANTDTCRQGMCNVLKICFFNWRHMESSIAVCTVQVQPTSKNNISDIGVGHITCRHARPCMACADAAGTHAETSLLASYVSLDHPACTHVTQPCVKGNHIALADCTPKHSDCVCVHTHMMLHLCPV